MKNLLKYYILDRQARPEGRATPKNMGPPKLNSPCSLILLQHQPTVFSSHTTPAAASSHQPASSIFLSHHSSSSLQHQHSEQGECRSYQIIGRGYTNPCMSMPKRQGDVPVPCMESHKIRWYMACLPYERHWLGWNSGALHWERNLFNSNVRSLHILFVSPSCVHVRHTDSNAVIAAP